MARAFGSYPKCHRFESCLLYTSENRFRRAKHFADAGQCLWVSVPYTKEELGEAVAYCHSRGVKVYVTCNTLPRNREFQELPRFLSFCCLLYTSRCV